MSKIVRLSGSEAELMKMDLKDKKIMAILVNEARISLTQLAKKVGLKRETIDYRIKRLIGHKFITGFAPSINFKLLGYSFYEVFLLLNESNENKRGEIIKKLAELPYTKSVLEYNDRWDIKHTILAKNTEEFDSICEEIQSEFGSSILEIERSAMLKGYSEQSLSGLFQPETRIPKHTAKEGVVKIDKKDLAILKCLCEDCRQSTYEIGEKIKLSPDAVGLRIKKMVQHGIIEKFTTFFDNSKMPLYWYTIAVQLRSFDSGVEEKVKKLVKNYPIMSARKTLGSWDMFFSVIAQSQKEIHDAVREIKKSLSESIKNYQTWLAYKEPYFTEFPEILEEQKFTSNIDSR